MKIAISTEGNYVSEHFGRCPYFTIFEVNNGKILKKEVIRNIEHSPGAVPKFLKEKGVDLIIAGGMGRKATEIFNQYGIDFIVGVSGDVDEIISNFIEGKLKIEDGLKEPCSGGHKEERCHKEEEGEEIICITSKGNDLNSKVDERFGRCNYFLFINLKDLSYEAVENPYKEAQSGAGIRAVKILTDRGVKTLLTGNLGTNASEALKAAKVKVHLDVSGTVKDVIEKFKRKELL